MERDRRSRLMLILALFLAFGLLAAACGDSDDGGSGAGDDDATATEDDTTDDGSETTEAGEDGNEGFDADQSGDDVAERATGGDDAADETLDQDGISTRNADSLVLALNDRRYTNQEPVPGGTLIYDWRADTPSLDPRLSSTFHLHYRVGPVYQRLYAPRVGPDVAHYEEILEPELASGDPEISEDGLTVTVNLRDDVTWQDLPPVGGRPFVAADVVATMEGYQEGGFQAGFLDRVDSIEAVDDHTVQFNLTAQTSPFPNFLGSHHMWILPQEAFDEASGYDFETPVGTGPFILTSHDVDIETTYVKNPDYWKTDDNGVQLPYLDGMRLVVITDQEQALAAFRSGETDISDVDLTIETQEQLAAEYPDGQYLGWLHGSTLIMNLNMAREEFQNADVRRAISMAIDREGMGQALRGGGTYSGPVNVNVLDYALPEEERAALQPYDPEGARELLEEAGYGDGFSVNFIHTDLYGPAYVAQTEWVAEDLRQLGLDVTIETLDYGTYFTQRWPEGQYDMQIGPQTPFQEADEWLRGQYATTGSRNWSGLSDAALDAMIEEQLALYDVDERREKVFEAQRYILENALPPLTLWTHVQRKHMQPWVRNFSPDVPSYGFVQLERTWLDSRE